MSPNRGAACRFHPSPGEALALVSSISNLIIIFNSMTFTAPLTRSFQVCGLSGKIHPLLLARSVSKSQIHMRHHDLASPQLTSGTPHTHVQPASTA